MTALVQYSTLSVHRPMLCLLAVHRPKTSSTPRSGIELMTFGLLGWCCHTELYLGCPYVYFFISCSLLDLSRCLTPDLSFAVVILPTDLVIRTFWSVTLGTADPSSLIFLYLLNFTETVLQGMYLCISRFFELSKSLSTKLLKPFCPFEKNCASSVMLLIQSSIPTFIFGS